MVVLKVLIILLILLFPLGELGRIIIYNEVSTTINDILVALVMLVWLAWLIIRKKLYEISKKQLTKPILFFVFFAFLSLLFNYNSFKAPEFIISFLYLLRFVAYAGIYFIISGFDLKFKRKILILMVICGTLIVLAGFIQYFLYPSLRNLYYLGWDEHLYRLFGSFLDPNFAASIISLFLIFLLSLLLSSSIKSKNITIILIILSILSFIALLLTYSRSGYLMFFASCVLLLLMFGKKKYVVILLLVFIIGIIILPKNLGGEGVKLLRTESIISRSEYLSNAITIFSNKPILGVGFNAYRYAQYRYGFIDDFSLRTSHAGAGTDNSFLFVLATTGIVGFIFYLYMWFKILKNAYYYKRHSGKRSAPRISNHSKGFWTRRVPDGNPSSSPRWSFGEAGQNDARLFQKTIPKIIIASSFGLFVNSFFINSLFYPPIMLWMWILIGFNSSTGSEFKENS